MKVYSNIPKVVISGDEEGWNLDIPVNPDFYGLFRDRIKDSLEKSKLSPLEKKVAEKKLFEYNYIIKKKDLYKQISKDLKIKVADVRIYIYRIEIKAGSKLRALAREFNESLRRFSSTRSFKGNTYVEDGEAEKNEAEFKKVSKHFKRQKSKKHKKNKPIELYTIKEIKKK